jgi:hypothetical protein
MIFMTIHDPFATIWQPESMTPKTPREVLLLPSKGFSRLAVRLREFGDISYAIECENFSQDCWAAADILRRNEKALG